MSVQTLYVEDVMNGIAPEILNELLTRASGILGTEGRRDGGVKTRVEDATTLEDGTVAVLVRRAGYCKYSSRCAWYIDRVALAGRTPGEGDWVVRVPSTARSVGEALSWLTPAEIRRAQVAGKPVYRQGDIYFRPARVLNMDALDGTRHTWRVEDGNLIIEHPEHRPLRLEGTGWRAVRQNRILGSAWDD